MKESGILLHISSLPGKYGCGTMGKCAYDFVDFLAKSKVGLWQILPVGPTSYGDSPYSSLSAFAFNPYFIDPDMLVEDGLISEADLPPVRNSKSCEFENIYNYVYIMLNKAFNNKDKYLDEFNKFIEEENYWLDDYAMYMVLKVEQENKPWYEWYNDFKYRNPSSLEWLKNEYANKILEYKFIQFIAFRQWKKLKDYANKKHIRIVGDMPIYCAYDSADVWMAPHQFQLGPNLAPENVAGCPPDYFNADGQLWGNPLYNWDFMKHDKYSWWINRVKHSFKICDILRIDHFRGFAGYYSIPYGAPNARGGHWVKGPGYALFKAINKECKNAEIIAENLGFLTPDVSRLLTNCGYPGMNIFQFELGDLKKVPLKKGYPENNVFYTGTHDNQTIMSFYNELGSEAKKLIDNLCDIKFVDRPNLKIIEFAMKQNSKYVIVPLQDYLGLTDDVGRMNIPSTPTGNWRYMAKKEDFSKGLSDYIRSIKRS